MTSAEIVRAMRERLTAKEQFIIRALYGIGRPILLKTDIAAALAWTPRRVTNAEFMALGKLSRAYGITARDLLECDDEGTPT